MSIVLIFSGQGHQHADMLRWLSEDPSIAAMRASLDVSDWRAALTDPAWARANANAQVLITATSLAAWSQLAPHFASASIAVDGIAGYSVGELAACAAAGVVSPGDAIHLARQRAAFMDEAGRRLPGGLSGVTGLSRADLEAVLVDTPVTVAIRNGEDSVVVGGPVDDRTDRAATLETVEARATARGGRCTRLAVSVASHTPLMRAAAEAFEMALGSVDMQAPATALFRSDGQRVWSTDQARAGLARQIASTVRWDEVMDQLAARSPSCVLEIGGGQALARLWQQRHPGIPARSADEFRTLDGVVAWCGRCAA
ncbi:ACP S-malonyltransferase [Roseateles sp. MS654]|uniref:ACP S-malonyltransferase n=1 Tax=Roseateles sp. MS654 TaxID=3412685 RepID=UPI003C309808